MNPLSTICLVACLLVAACAVPSQSMKGHGNSLSNKLKPSEWLSVSDLENLPSVDEVTIQQLENMPSEEGAELVNSLYHLSQISRDLEPSFAPSANDIPTYIVKANGQKEQITLNQLVQKAKQQDNFGDEEVIVFITGLPQTSQTVSKANRKLVQAFVQRYSGQQQQQQSDYDKNQRSSSEEDSNESQKNSNKNKGNIVVIDLGSQLTNLKRIAMLDIARTGGMIGKILVQLTNENDVSEETVHIIGQGIAAHVAGEAGRQYSRLTGHKLRRITGLDPSKIYAKQPNTLVGLARGDADFVDAIHTSAYGLGTQTRSGDADFYPNGPNVNVPGAKNIVKASMRATRYFAESVRPGNGRNFPAVPANSLNQYKNNNGYGPRAYMGIKTDFDAQGDYILQVNPKSPFGRSAPAEKQTYHAAHQPWSQMKSQ
ncbi:vitellogenin-1-like [Teleopsis dalmanni]|uniref:vitellogenin-1-like n=1 Tax=Teleopsis dalmanni TaxID=139649 RepID=UPI0018CCB4F3|nr:vitellogenin-1-like [Teleopsis dalmanni]XP_037938133.1 vitellogenin-1-like [Teleopsis dalmanni]